MGSILRSALISGAIVLGSASMAMAQSGGRPESDYLVDLSANHWCYDCSVKIIDKYKIMSGYQDHTFRGDWPVDRYMLAAAVAKTFNRLQLEYGLDIAVKAEHPNVALDILPEHWAYPYVHKLAAENGLLSQLFQQGQFKGKRVLTRKEMAYALSEFMVYLEKKSGKQLRPERREAQLAVDLEARSPFNDYVELALNRYQFMNLYRDHTFRPEEPVTRYDLAASLCEIFKIFENMNG